MDLAVFPDEEEEEEAGLDLLPVVGRVRLLLPRVFLSFSSPFFPASLVFCCSAWLLAALRSTRPSRLRKPRYFHSPS